MHLFFSWKQGVGGLERPEIFGLPAGVQHMQEVESGHKFLTALATVGGTQALPGFVERNVAPELMSLIKMVNHNNILYLFKYL